MPRVRDKPQNVVHSVGNEPLIAQMRAKRNQSARLEGVHLRVWLDRRTFEVFEHDAREAGVMVETFVSKHLARCAGTV